MRTSYFAMVAVGFTAWAVAEPAARASTYGTVLLANNPAAYYQMNETSGTTAFDSSVNAPQNATYGGPVTLGTAGPQPPAFVGMDSGNKAPTVVDPGTVSDYLDTGTAISTLSSSAYSYSLWFNDDSNGNLHYIGGRYAAGSYLGDSLFSYGGLTFFDGNTSFGAVPVSANAWHQAALTRNGTAVTVYLDGAPVITATSTAQYGSSKEFVIGNRGDLAPTANFKGALDEFAVFNSVLTAGQVATMYEAAFLTPEPSTLLLLGVGGAWLWRQRTGRWQRRR